MIKPSIRSILDRFKGAVSRQFRFSGFSRRPKNLLISAAIAAGALYSPAFVSHIQRERALRYIDFVNPQLNARPRFREVYAWKTLKGPILLSFSGSVETEAELAQLKEFIADTRPPEPYTVAVFVLPESR